MNAGSIIATLKLKVDEFKQGMSDAKAELTNFSEGTKKTVGVVTKTLGGIGLAATAATGFLAKGAIEASAEYETLTAKMETALQGNKAAAQEYMKWATDFAKQTPFESTDVVDATVKLKAYGIEAKTTLTQIGNMASGMGKGLDQAVEAVADAQTGELERLKEFGITKQMLIDKALALGKGEIVNAQGQITNQKALNEALFAIMDERFQGGMERQSKTFNGMMSNLKDSWSAFLRVVGDVLLPIAKDLLDKYLLPAMTKLQSLDPNAIRVPIETAINAIAFAFKLLFDIVVGVVSFFNEYKTAIMIVAGLITTLLLPALIAMATQMIVMKAQALWAIITSTYTWITANWALAASMIAAYWPILLIIAGIGLLVAAILWLINNWDTVKAVTLAVWDAIKSFLMVTWEAIKAAGIAVWEALKAAFTATWNAIKAVGEAIWNVIKIVFMAYWDAIKWYFTTVLNIYLTIFTTAWNAIKAAGTAIWNGIKSVFTTVWNSVLSVFTNVVNTIKNLGSDAWGFLKNGFSDAINFVVGTFKGLYNKVMGSLDTLIGGIKNKVMKAKEWLTELNPFKRHSPSLVDNVLAGVDIIKKTYAGVSDMEIAPPSIGTVTAGHYTAGMFEGEGASGGTGGGTNYNAPLVQVENMHVRDDRDVRDISSELYNLQRNADRKRGR